MTTAVSLPPVYTLIALDSADSTNAEAARRAQDGAPDGLVVWAREQTAGRGRRGRDWVSPLGDLYVSILLRPSQPVAEIAQLGFVAGLAAVQACGELCPPMTDLRLKWPNDLLINEKKAGGVLLEAGPVVDGCADWIVVGFGLNLRQAPAGFDDPHALQATSVAGEGGGAHDAEVALSRFARAFLSWRDDWVHEGFGRVRKAWLSRAYGRGEALTARLETETIEGVFEDLDETGRLLLKLSDGTTRMIAAGDVFARHAAG